MLKYIDFLKCFHVVSYSVLKDSFRSWDSPRVCDAGVYLEQSDIDFIIVAICGYIA